MEKNMENEMETGTIGFVVGTEGVVGEPYERRLANKARSETAFSKGQVANRPSLPPAPSLKKHHVHA